MIIGFILGDYYISNQIDDISQGDILVVLFNVVPVLFTLGDVINKITAIIEATHHLRNIVEIIEGTCDIQYDDSVPRQEFSTLHIGIKNLDFS